MATDVFSQLFKNGAPQQYGLYFTAPGTEGPNTPEWISLDGANNPSMVLGQLAPYMNMSGADLQANWGSLPAAIKAKLGNSPTEFAKKVSYAPDGQGGWTNTFVEKDTGLMSMAGGFGPLALMGGLAAGAGALTGALGGAAGAGAAGSSAAGEIAALTGSGTYGGAGMYGGLGASGGLAGIDAPWGSKAGASFDPTADFGADYFSGASDYTGSALNELSSLPSPTNLQDLMTKMDSTPAGKSLLNSLTGGASDAAGAASVLSKILGSGGGTGTDWASIIGKLGAAGLGAIGSSQQANSLQDLAAKYQEYGAPSRARYEGSMSPGFDPMSIPGYAGALDSTSKSVLARLSATGGNPFGNPGGLIEANKAIVSGTALPAINEYQRLNANTGFGSSMNAALNLQTQGVGADANTYNALGYGLNALTAPKEQSLADLYKSFGFGGLA